MSSPPEYATTIFIGELSKTVAAKNHEKSRLAAALRLPRRHDPLLAVVVGVQAARASLPTRIVTCVLCGWLVFVGFQADTYYIAYFNELGGGSANGYRYLIDSNCDWGQDGKRLKRWMAANKVDHIYLDYFGTGVAIEYHKMPNTRVTPDQARQLRDGWLVVSATRLMRPEYAWLRESHQPVARIAHTLFVYHLTTAGAAKIWT